MLPLRRPKLKKDMPEQLDFHHHIIAKVDYADSSCLFRNHSDAPDFADLRSPFDGCDTPPAINESLKQNVNICDTGYSSLSDSMFRGTTGMDTPFLVLPSKHSARFVRVK